MNRKGFTLIEMVITLIVGSILVFGIAGFVELGARGTAILLNVRDFRLKLSLYWKKSAEKCVTLCPTCCRMNLSQAQTVSRFTLLSRLASMPYQEQIYSLWWGAKVLL